MRMHLASVARTAAFVAAAICASTTKGVATQPGSVGAPFRSGPFIVRPLAFPTSAIFKRWTSETGKVRVCRTRCGHNGGGSASPYEGTPLYGSRYTSIAINSSATFALKEPKRVVTFIWGTPDKGCNVADFYDSTETLIGEIDAAEIPDAGYYKIKSPTPIGSIVFSEGDCRGDVYFEVAQGPSAH
jgi:hypothetical protein